MQPFKAWDLIDKFLLLQATGWLKHLSTRGWAIVPGVLTQEKAKSYAEKGYDWLESWGLGFDRNDPATRQETNVPWHIRGGLYARYEIDQRNTLIF